jgi:hypothetical protein
MLSRRDGAVYVDGGSRGVGMEEKADGTSFENVFVGGGVRATQNAAGILHKRAAATYATLFIRGGPRTTRFFM